MKYVLRKKANGDFVSHVEEDGRGGFGFNCAEDRAVLFDTVNDALMVLYNRTKRDHVDALVLIYKRQDAQYTYEEV